MKTMLALGSVLTLLLSGCAGGGSGDPRDAGPGFDSGTPEANECETFMDCPMGLVCRAVGPVLRCVRPEWMPPRGDGTDCGECPAPGECREGACIQPEERGMICEFDDECVDGELCIAAHCTPDPRMPRTCSETIPCPGALMCVAGMCACTATVDCPIGFSCEGGFCVGTPGGMCLADADCPADYLCEAGRCIDDMLCDIGHPDLAGTWDMLSHYHFREVLPDWLATFLDAVAGPFRFIAGDSADLDAGLPGWVEDAIAPAIRDWADTYLPPWARDLLGAIADLNDILSTWTVQERMILRPGAERDLYVGTHEWLSVEFTYRARTVRGTPMDIIDWRFEPAEFNAAAVCGQFLINRHSVDVSIGAIIGWLVDGIVYELSDGRFATIEDAFAFLTTGYCGEIARVADEAVDYPGVYTAVNDACVEYVGRFAMDIVRSLREARLPLDLMTLKGYAPIAGPNSLRPGTWEGTLAGRSFPGDFDASR